MKVKGFNKIYEVEIKKMNFQGKKGISIRVGNLMTGMASVIISEENWRKIEEELFKRVKNENK
jgi:hypothetical protein